MNPCAPRLAIIRHAVIHRPRHARHAVHYVASRKTRVVAGHHAATGPAAPHVPIRRHPRPAAHHAAAPDTGACGASGAVERLRAGTIGGLAASGGAVGIGVVAALAGPLSGGGDGGAAPSGDGGWAGGSWVGGPLTGGSQTGGSQTGGPQTGGLQTGGLQTGGPHTGSPQIGVPPLGVPQTGLPGGQPLPGVPEIGAINVAPSPVSVPEPSSMVLLVVALAMLMLARRLRAMTHR